MTRIIRNTGFILAFIITFTMCCTTPVNAASKKSVYVLTKMTMTDYTDGDVSKISAKFTYKKNGLLTRAKVSVDGIVSANYKYKYGKKSRIKSQSSNMYFLGEKYDSSSAKYTYNKKGYLTKARAYTKSGKLSATTKYTLTKKGYCKKARDYNGNGYLKETRKYTLDKKGNIKKKRVYSSKGKIKETSFYEKKGNTITIKTYNAKDKLIETTVNTYKHGNIVKQISYDEINNHKKIDITKYSYKKIKTKKHSIVKKQQNNIAEYIVV